MREHVLVMAKAPVPGKVKTRLCPPLSLEAAARVAEAALADTLAAVGACGAARRILALDGAPGAWLPPGFEVIPQVDGPLDVRLAAAWRAAGGPGVQIAMDTPQVSGAQLDGALAMVAESSRAAVLGPALDGGWWLIGWDGAEPAAVFRGVPMSTGRTGRVQAQRLRRLGYRVRTLGVERDIDTVADLTAVAYAHPGLRVSRLARAPMVEAVA